MITFCCFSLSPLSISQILIASFLAICFLQSGIDKIIDRKGNLDWLTGHFSNSPLKNIVPLLLMIITLSELLGGFLCIVGIFDFLINGTKLLMLYGFTINAISLIALFLGQRLAKDYEGAAVLLGYFILTIIGILSFSAI
ncbi:MAG: DoxX family protein [Candidatus Marinimicrobia bacterium]|nr:DoxX family protein [Candidatus Neomarinimicrobiota bacterium]MBT5955236.1 DoxX family protein [Candidatus Neomarinimicrobiota bacterium]MBT6870151.1 DoxX family protein [Candidatus Neomarinimicrobiota bacterium]MBT7377835.1 DoxX family protein [Candidatus Neomarinimicrobiota bacterium]